jgi:hypothetical protein
MAFISIRDNPVGSLLMGAGIDGRAFSKKQLFAFFAERQAGQAVKLTFGGGEVTEYVINIPEPMVHRLLENVFATYLELAGVHASNSVQSRVDTIKKVLTDITAPPTTVTPPPLTTTTAYELPGNLWRDANETRIAD